MSDLRKERYRQFHQVGVEVLGSDHPALEAEVIEMLERFLHKLGAKGLQTACSTRWDVPIAVLPTSRSCRKN